MRFKNAILASIMCIIFAQDVLAQSNQWPRYIPVRPDGSTIDPTPSSGGATAAKQDTTNSALGTSADTAAPTGNGSLNAIEKAIRDKLYAGLNLISPITDGPVISLSTTTTAALSNATYTDGWIPTSSGYSSINVAVNPSIFLAYEYSNDKSAVFFAYGDSQNVPPNNNDSSANMRTFPVRSAYFRIRPYSTGGNATATVQLKSAPYAPNNVRVTQDLSSGAWPVAPSVGTSQANPIYASESATTLATSQATATTTSAQLCAARTGRRAVTVQNLGTTAVSIGASGVTTATGALLPGSAGSSLTLNTSAAVFGVTGTGSQAVACVELY